MADRRRFPRRPKLMRFLLLWRRSEEKVFTTDVSRCGFFLRTSIAPPQGAELKLIVPKAAAYDECVAVYARVVRIVRRGDPYNPLGGIGVELERIESPLGTEEVNELMAALLGPGGAPKLAPRHDPVVVSMPDCSVSSLAPPPEEADDFEEQGFDGDRELTRTVVVQLAVFCRWRNMIIQARLDRLSAEQAVLTGLKVVPEPGDVVTVRLLGVSDSRFRGLQFTGQVDHAEGHACSLVLNPDEKQPEIGSLRAFLRDVSQSGLNTGPE